MCETDSSMEYSEWSKTAISKFKCEAEREEEIIANVLQQTLSPTAITARCLPMFYNRHSSPQQDGYIAAMVSTAHHIKETVLRKKTAVIPQKDKVTKNVIEI